MQKLATGNLHHPHVRKQIDTRAEVGLLDVLNAQLCETLL